MAKFIEWISNPGNILIVISVCFSICASISTIIYLHNCKHGGVKVKKEKLPHLKMEKPHDFYNATIKDVKGVIIFNQDFKNRISANKGVKKAVKELVKANKQPQSYKLTKHKVK